MSTEVRYSEVLGDLHTWYDSRRAEGGNFHPILRRVGREIHQTTRSQVLDIFPSITHTLRVFMTDNELIFADSPVDGFPNSPYARWHVDLQTLSHILITESLMQAQNIREMPDDLKAKVPSALNQVATLPTPHPPRLHPDVLRYLSRLPEERFIWAKEREATPVWYTLLKRVLASKYYHKSDTSLGYNRRAIQLCDSQMIHLDLLASCTPWQMRRNPAEYLSRVHQSLFAFINNIKLAEHMESGRMFSQDFANDDLTSQWETALETGELPVRMTASNVTTEPDE